MQAFPRFHRVTEVDFKAFMETDTEVEKEPAMKRGKKRNNPIKL